MLPVSAVYGDEIIQYLPELQGSAMLKLFPADVKPGIVKLDYDMDWGSEYFKSRLVSRPSRDGKPEKIEGLPATARAVLGGAEYKDLETVEFIEPLQRYMFELCREASPNYPLAEAKKDFAGAFWGGRALCDFAGADTRADYINMKNLDAGSIILKPMLFSGDLFGFDKIVNVPGNGNCYRVRAINVKKASYNPSNPKPYEDYLRQFHPSTHPWLFFKPTNSVRKPIMDTSSKYRIGWVEYVSEPWHWFNYRMVMPLFSNRDYVFIPVNRAYELKSNIIPSPYVRSTVPKSESPFFTSPYF